MSSAKLDISSGLAHGSMLGLRYTLALPKAALRGRDGWRLGSGAGASLDFHDYRDYHPGDDLRHLDWSVYARSDREMIKLFREEVAPHLDIVLDTSRSMALPATGKGAASAALAAALAVAATQAQCSHTLWLAGTRLSKHPNSQAEPTAWPPFALDQTEPPTAALLSLAPPWRPNSIRLFVSDLLFPADPTALLTRLSANAAAVGIIQLLAAVEERPVAGGHCRLEEIESGDYADLLIDDAACAAYQTALVRHRDLWSTSCRRFGATFVALNDDQIMVANRLTPLAACGLLEGN